mmetsp:Transcript_67085/g.193908  ORF Transcript_67085/g.193908 Transcript_67085/m.193908 type:complete len:205 (-) Transcript_67085:2-616(-)
MSSRVIPSFASVVFGSFTGASVAFGAPEPLAARPPRAAAAARGGPEAAAAIEARLAAVTGVAAVAVALAAAAAAFETGARAAAKVPLAKRIRPKRLRRAASSAAPAAFGATAAAALPAPISLFLATAPRPPPALPPLFFGALASALPRFVPFVLITSSSDMSRALAMAAGRGSPPHATSRRKPSVRCGWKRAPRPAHRGPRRAA